MTDLTEYVLTYSFCYQKNDKWQKMMNIEDSVVVLTDFLEKGESLVLVIYVNQQGILTLINDFPNTSKNKVCTSVVCIQSYDSSVTVILH